MKWKIVFLVTVLSFLSNVVEGQKKRRNTSAQDTSWINEALIYRSDFALNDPPIAFKDWTQTLVGIKKLGFTGVSIGCIQPYTRDSIGTIWVRDFNTTDYRLGKVSNLKSLVLSAHELGLKVIMDWIPDRLSADHQWRVEHSGWFTLDSTTIANGTLPELDYTIPDVWLEMAVEMGFWLKNCNIDGFNIISTHKFEDAFWKGIESAIESGKSVYYAGDTSSVSLFSDQLVLSIPSFHEMIVLTEQKELSLDSLIHLIEINFKGTNNKVLIDLFSGQLDENDPFQHAELILSFALGGIPQFPAKFVELLSPIDSMHCSRCIKNLSSLKAKKRDKQKISLSVIRDPYQNSVLILKRNVGEISNYFMLNFNSAPVRVQSSVLSDDGFFIDILESEPHLFEGIDRSFVVPGFDCLFLSTQ